MWKQRPDGFAVLGVIGIAGLIIVGWIILSIANVPVAPEAWLALGTAIGIVGGWVGKPNTSPESVQISDEPVQVDPEVAPEVQPDVAPVPAFLVNDREQRRTISEHLAQAGK